jgi:hypothetical protein
MSTFTKKLYLNNMLWVENAENKYEIVIYKVEPGS